jgi:hypothetical protein
MDVKLFSLSIFRQDTDSECFAPVTGSRCVLERAIGAQVPHHVGGPQFYFGVSRPSLICRCTF